MTEKYIAKKSNISFNIFILEEGLVLIGDDKAYLAWDRRTPTMRKYLKDAATLATKATHIWTWTLNKDHSKDKFSLSKTSLTFHRVESASG